VPRHGADRTRSRLADLQPRQQDGVRGVRGLGFRQRGGRQHAEGNGAYCRRPGAEAQHHRGAAVTAAMDRFPDRREFLRFLAASPLLAGCPSVLEALSQSTPAAPLNDVIGSPADALSVFDFEAAARKALPPAHWGYMATGVDDDATLRANREGFSHYQLRTRRLVDTTNIDMSVDILGTKWETPILLAPSGTLFDPKGEGVIE